MGGHNWAGHANEELMHPQSVWRVPDVLARANCLRGWQLPPPPRTHYCTYTQPLTHMCAHVAFGYDADPMQPKSPVVWHTVSGLPTSMCAISLTPCCKHLPSCNSANIFWRHGMQTVHSSLRAKTILLEVSRLISRGLFCITCHSLWYNCRPI